MKFLYTILCGFILFNAYTNGAYKNKAPPPPPPLVFPNMMQQSNMQIPYQWNMLEYSFPNEAAMQAAITMGNLIPSNGIPIDVQPHYYNKNKLRTFITIPRFQGGIPYTLAIITEEKGTNGPKIQPYPNYEAHNNANNCDAITSAFRVAITECNQMWIIDSGVIGAHAVCPPQLLLFDLNTDQIIHRYRFNASLYTPSASLFVTPIVDVKDPPPRGSCRRAMIYIADVTFHGLVVYDYMQNNAWRVENKFMYPDPDYGTHTVAGESFNLMDGIIGMTTEKQNLYFHPMASITEYAVPLRVLENSTNFAASVEGMPEMFRPLGKRTSECVATATDGSGNIYCVTFNPIELISWNINTPYGNKNFKKLAINPDELQFVSGMKVVTNLQGKEELWMISNRFQKMAAGTQNFNEVNFRIVVRSLADVSSGGGPKPNGDLHNKLVFSS